MLGGILQGILWTVLATDVFQAATGRQALPAWLVIGIAGRWMGHLSGIGAALNVRAAGSVQDAWVVRLLRRPAFFLPLWLLGFAVALATPIFWTVLFVLLVRR